MLKDRFCLRVELGGAVDEGACRRGRAGRGPRRSAGEWDVRVRGASAAPQNGAEVKPEKPNKKPNLWRGLKGEWGKRVSM